MIERTKTPGAYLADYVRAMERTGRLPTTDEIMAFSPFVSKDLINRVIEHIEFERKHQTSM